MIAALKGELLCQNAEQIVIDVNGVGYEVTASSQLLEEISRNKKSIKALIYTDVKENSISLFGFENTLEKEVFLLLKKVKGIGSKTAMAILSNAGAETVLNCIGQNDISRLKSVPGVGGKTAERLIVELRENVKDFVKEIKVGLNSKIEIISEGKRTTSLAQGAEYDVQLALEKLGIAKDKAHQIIALTLKQNEDKISILRTDAGELLRLALSNL